MEETRESGKARDEVFSSLSEIFGHTERLIEYLMGKRRDEARWLGVLAAILVLFSALMAVVAVNLLADMYVTKYFIENPNSNLIFFGSLLALSLLAGFTTHFHTRQRYTEEYVPWKNTLSALKKTVAESRAEETSIMETTLRLMDQTSTWLSDVMEYKREEALMYGFSAFLIVSLISSASPMGLPVASFTGVVVWLYFRYEKRKEATQQIQIFKSWKEKFEKGKDHFLKSVC